MSRVKSRDTGLEKRLRSALHCAGLRFRKHVGSLPGRPDLEVARARVAVFIDGDFLHGYRFPAWEHNLSGFWKKKIRRAQAGDSCHMWRFAGIRQELGLDLTGRIAPRATSHQWFDRHAFTDVQTTGSGVVVLHFSHG